MKLILYMHRITLAKVYISKSVIVLRELHYSWVSIFLSGKGRKWRRSWIQEEKAGEGVMIEWPRDLRVVKLW